MTIESHKETLGFQTEVNQLLKLMINSLYSNKEIFLRELISNASDACDKLRFEALADDALYEGDSDFKIRVDFDKEKRTITITDNGIGMTREEVVDHIGTIAKSGTKQFMSALTGDQAKDSQLIGQFGVGFYSSFIVADKVTLTTRKAGLGHEHGARWESEAEGTYSLETVEKADRGTEIVLHLKEGEDELLESYQLRSIITRYSDHINLPIEMKSTEEGKEDEYEAVNRASALWVRPKQEITEEDYKEFYKHVAHDFEDPLTYIHNRVEGTQSYTSLLYIPKRAPFDLYERERSHGIKLYVKRVFIMDDADQLMPTYLRFVRGVIDSDDLPLNISREILQKNQQIDKLRSASVSRILGKLEKMAKNEQETYAEFWKTFGKVMKEGIAEDTANRERIAKLLRFSSTHNDNDVEDVSLDAYIERMKEGQKDIYYITAESYAAAIGSPHLEVFRKKGIEVLLMHERVDDWMISYLSEFEGKSLKSIAKGTLDLGDLEDKEEKEAQKETEEAFKPLVERMQKAIGDQVKEVRVSHRLTDSPSCLVVEEHDMGASLQKLMKEAGHSMPEVTPIMEVNPDHALVEFIKAENDEERFKEWSLLLFDQALLTEGGQLNDPVAFVRRMNGLLLDDKKVA